MNEDQFEQNIPLTPAVFYILLALFPKDRHGYEIMKEVAANSNGFIKMGPGTLYGSINRMLAAGLIREMESKPDPFENNERRRYYRITDRGRSVLSAEIQRFADVLEVAKNVNLGPAT